MPIIQLYLAEGAHDDAAIGALLRDVSHFYAETFYPGVDPLPLDRVRAFVTLVAPGYWATAGVLIAEGGEPAPYFTCLALAGRPVEQLQRLLAGCTDRIAHHLGCRRGAIRGQVFSIDPAHWSIGGEPASLLRSGEAALRRAG